MKKLVMTLVVVSAYIIFGGSMSGDDTIMSNLKNIVYTADLPTVVVEDTRIRESDHELLSRLIFCEAGVEPFAGKRAVADIVIYISREKGWSITKVIYDVGRFDGIHTNNFHIEPNRESRKAARLALDGKHILPYGVMYFHNPVISTDTRWVNYISKYKYKQIGNHLFCYDPAFFPEKLNKTQYHMLP